MTGSGKRGHFTQKLKNELLALCCSAYFAGQNGTYHRAWSPTFAELHPLVLSENFNYCIIRKLRFLITGVVRAILIPYLRINLLRGRGDVFFTEETKDQSFNLKS